MSIKETLSHHVQVDVTLRTGSNRFGKLPEDVLARADLDVYDKIVLLVLNMESYNSGAVAISDGVISQKARISRTQAVKSRANLERVGLIQRSGVPMKQVQPYRLLHPQMVSRSGELAVPAAVTTRRGLPKCSKCGVRCKALLKTGWCRSCNLTLRIRRVVAEEIKAAAS